MEWFIESWLPFILESEVVENLLCRLIYVAICFKVLAIYVLRIHIFKFDYLPDLFNLKWSHRL